VFCEKDVNQSKHNNNDKNSNNNNKEIQRMWNLKCTVIPVIIGATGIVTKSLRKNL
jgi:hypothetical protein